MHWHTTLTRHIFSIGAFAVVFLAFMAPAAPAYAIYVQYFTAQPQSLYAGESALLRFHCQDQDGYTIYTSSYQPLWSGGSEDVYINTGPLYQDTTYLAKCHDNRLTNIVDAWGQTTITILAPAAPVLPTSTFLSDKTSYAYNDNAGLSWSSTNMTACNVWNLTDNILYSGGPTQGNVSTGAWGGLKQNPTTFMLTCAPQNGSANLVKNITVSVAAAPATDLCPSLAGTQTSYPSGSSPANSCTCPASYTYTQGTNTCTAPSGSITATLTAKVGGASATGLKVGQSAVLTGTFAAPSGQTLTYTSIADNAGASLTGASGATTPRTYTFTPTAAGTFLFYARAASTGNPNATNYASLTLTVCQATQTWNGSSCVAAGTTDVCPSLAGTQATYPSGSSPAGSCTCPSGTTYNSGSNACTVTATVGQPTLAITGNNVANNVTVTLGQPVAVRGTYAAASGDAIIFTALNDNNNNALPGTSNTTAASPKTYTFTATAPGQYVFYPAALTAAYPSWNNYGKSLLVTVNCPAGQTAQGGACVAAVDVCSNIAGMQATPPANGTSSGGLCSCNTGYSLQGTSCVPVAACAGAHQVGTPPNCTCDVGYQMQGGICVQVLCPGQNEVNWPTCSCAPGYTRDGGTNMCIRQPVLNIKVNGLDAVRVRKGSSVTITWSASGVASGSCRVTTNTGTTIASGDSGTTASAVGNQTTYRLTCTNDAGSATTKEANVTLIPELIEQ